MKIQKSQFDQLEKIIEITIPDDIKAYYIDQDREEDEFMRTVLGVIDEIIPASFVIQIDESFAEEIVSKYHQLEESQLSFIMEEIELNDKENYRYYDNLLSYLLLDGVNQYDEKQDRFVLTFLNDIYQNLPHKEEAIKVIFVTQNQCGGWKGIILKGKNIGYVGSGFHGENQEVEVDGNFYPYNSNLLEGTEKSYLDSLPK